MSSFSERTVLVTGGGTGIGKGCAQHFLAGGATVTIAGPDRDMLESAAAELLQATRLAFLYVMASCCWRYGRIEAAVGYTDAGQAVIGRAAMRCRAAFDGMLGAVYLTGFRPSPTRHGVVGSRFGAGSRRDSRSEWPTATTRCADEC